MLCGSYTVRKVRFMSSVPAQKLREIVLQILYSIGIGSTDREALETLLSHELSLSQTTISQAYDRALTVLKGLSQIDEDIASASQAYDQYVYPLSSETSSALASSKCSMMAIFPPK